MFHCTNLRRQGVDRCCPHRGMKCFHGMEEVVAHDD